MIAVLYGSGDEEANVDDRVNSQEGQEDVVIFDVGRSKLMR